MAGKQVVLRSLAFDCGWMMGGGGGGDGGDGWRWHGWRGGGGGGGMASLPNGAAFNILTVNVGRTATPSPELGPLPPSRDPVQREQCPQLFATPRPFTLEMQPQMIWTINGRVYEMTAVADDEMVNRDETMAWEWINNSPIPHPMHIHNVQFQVVQRTPPGSEQLQHDQPGLRSIPAGRTPSWSGRASGSRSP